MSNSNNNVNSLDLGKPIGNATQPQPTSGEHGAGVGVSGGHSSANAHNSQSGGQFVGGNSAFNAGLGGDHASAGIPRDGAHPIADKFMGQSGEQDTVSGTYGGGSTRDALEGQSHAHTIGSGHASGLGAGAVGAGVGGLAGAGAASAIGGQYAGSGANDGLTGQSNASVTGAGVGPLGENTGDQARAAALSSTAGGAGAAGAAGVIGTGVGPQGGAGGHYSSESNQTGSSRHEQPATTSNLVKEGEATGHFGHADNDESRGQPISDPKSLDSGGPHGLVYDEKTGKYLHRHELEGQK